MYAKVFNQIFDSSIAEDPELRFTFTDLLVLSDKNGVVDMTHEAIARRTNRPLELIRKTISILEAPDTRSRTPEHEGRRITRLDEHRDWGWVINNYERFRQIANEDQRREKTYARVVKYRNKQGKSSEETERNVLKRFETPETQSKGSFKSKSKSIKEELPSEAIEWNNAVGLKKIQAISSNRRTALSARRSEPFFQTNWREAIQKVSASDFCKGKNDRGWIADFDFFLRPGTLVKIMEGKYDNRSAALKPVGGNF